LNIKLLKETIHIIHRTGFKFACLFGGILFFSSFFYNARKSNNEQVDALFGQQVQETLSHLKNLKEAIDKKVNKKTLQNKFRAVRLSYKKAAVLIDYFYPADSKLINSPALPRPVDDSPGLFIPPHGLQVLEEIFFSEINKDSLALAKEEIALIQKILNQFLREPNRSYKFKNEYISEALCKALIRVMTLDISGFDSPVAQYSIPESAAALQSIHSLLSVYHRSTESDRLFENAIQYLQTHQQFNRFDQLTFFTDYAQPLYATLMKMSREPSFVSTEGKRPLNTSNDNFFSPETFNVSFFGPSKSYAVTTEKVALGKKLFFDPLLSSTKIRSCASCHKPELAFTDGLKTALSIDGKKYLSRNTPTLWNSVFQTKQFYDSRASMLEHQLNAVVHNPEEMGGSLAQSVKVLSTIPSYVTLFNAAYAGEEEKINQYTIANAISAYVRSLVSFNSSFDQYMRGDKSKLTREEKKGFNLFMGKAKCGTCHFMPLFNGLLPPDYTETESEVIGVPATNDKSNSRLDPDEGKYNFTKSPLHKFAFKTPTLRNIELTAPYMHNGVYNTLEEVMDFYNKGGGSGLKIAPENQTLPDEKLNLSKKEIRAVIAFMRTLTDSAVLKYK